MKTRTKIMILLAIVLTFGAYLFRDNNYFFEILLLLDGIILGIVYKAFSSEPYIPSRRRIIITDNYDDSVKSIYDFLEWMVNEKKVCQKITLYVKDELNENDYNLISHYGLTDPSPMYGPLVFDDFRKILRNMENPKYDKNINRSSINENKQGFLVREKVVSRAVFKYEEKLTKNSKDKIIHAALYVNWVEKPQEFSPEQKAQLCEYKDEILVAVKKIKGPSRKRQIANHRELESRRWIDNHILSDAYKDFERLLLKATYTFLDGIEPKHLRLIIAWENDDSFFIFMDDYQGDLEIGKFLYDKNGGKLLNEEMENFIKVIDHTRPLYLEGEYGRRIIVPIKGPQRLSGKTNSVKKENILGILSVESYQEKLEPEMVKPLCSLAEHFGMIKEALNTRYGVVDDQRTKAN